MPPGRLLELGCGNGYALAAMKELGWDVAGIEPDREAAALAEARGLTVAAPTLDKARFPGSHFDVIMIRNAFGYIPNPLETLAECRRILRFGGRLALNVPNLSSAGHKRFGSAWVMLDPPREHFVYSAASLRACIQKAGLSVQSLRVTPRLTFAVWIMSATIHRHGRLEGYAVARTDSLIHMPGALASQVLELARSMVGDAGEELFLVATKDRSA